MPPSPAPRWLGRDVITLLLVCVAYQPTWNAGFIWDDPEYILNNLNLRSAAGLWEMWVNPRAGTHQWYPLTLTTFWFEYQLWGDQPLGYHVVNMFLHGINACLLRRVLERLDVAGAWMAALLFAVHPVHVESVAWVTERKNVLSGFFYLLAFLGFARSGALDEGSPPATPRVVARTFVLHLLALLSKTVTATLPAALLLATWWRRGRIRVSDVTRQLPLLALGGCMGLFTAHLEHSYVGAQGESFELGAWERVLLAARNAWFYAMKLVVPSEVSFNYPRWEISVSDPWLWLSLVAFFAFTGGLVFIARSRRGLLTAWLGFLGTLFPALGFFNVYPFRFSFVADHFQYLASAFLLSGVVGLATHIPLDVVRRVAAPLVVCVFTWLSWMQAHAYRDTVTLWTDVIEKNPASFIGHVNLAHALGERAQWPEAEGLLRRAVALQPNDASGHRNLGVALGKQGRWAEAIPALERALELSRGDVETAFSLAVACAQGGQAERSRKLAEEILAVTPDHAGAHALLGRPAR